MKFKKADIWLYDTEGYGEYQIFKFVEGDFGVSWWPETSEQEDIMAEHDLYLPDRGCTEEDYYFSTYKKAREACVEHFEKVKKLLPRNKNGSV